MAPRWARWLHNPCRLGGPHRFKAGSLNKKKSRPITTTLANAQTGSHQPRSDPEAGSGSKSFFVLFSHCLNSPQNSEYFEYRHIGWNKKIFPCPMPKTKSPAPPAPTKHIVPYNNFGVCRGGGGGWGPPLGSGLDQERPPCRLLDGFSSFWPQEVRPDASCLLPASRWTSMAMSDNPPTYWPPIQRVVWVEYEMLLVASGEL